MRLRRVHPMAVCQNCEKSNNKKGKWKRTWRRRSDYKKGEHESKIGYWHIFCEKREKFYPWDYKKSCFKMGDALKGWKTLKGRKSKT